MPKVYQVKKARKDFPEFGIKAGDSYYYWGFAFGPTLKSKTYPTRQQLTRSGFLQSVYDLEEYGYDRENLEDSVQDLVSQIEELREQCEDSLSNMPDHLQETSESGMLLQERIDALEDWVSQLEGVDLDVDGELTEEEKKQVSEDVTKDNPDLDGEPWRIAVEEAYAERLEEKKNERIDEILEELQGISSGL